MTFLSFLFLFVSNVATFIAQLPCGLIGFENFLAHRHPSGPLARPLQSDPQPGEGLRLRPPNRGFS